MGNFTLMTKEVIEILYGTTDDEDDYVQTYEAVEFNGVKYGKLPTLPEYDSIGLGYYPIFDENYRKILNGKIIDEFYNQEICTETIENWTLILRKRMDQIMPFYNQMYASTQIPYEALESMRIHSVGNSTLNGKETTDANINNATTTENGSRAVNSNFPQTMLAGNADYASSAVDSNGKTTVNAETNQNSESNSDTNSNSDTLVTGYQGAASDLINKYRASLINVDMMILAELGDCFMLLLNNGDEYFARNYDWGYYV